MKFNWSLTERKLCVIIPNYNRDWYIDQTIDNTYNFLNTILPSSDFCILIVSDRFPEYPANKYSNVFSISCGDSSDLSDRNGLFARNYAIKRCQSAWILQKDPEIMWFTNAENHGSHQLLSIINGPTNCIARPKYCMMLTAEKTIEYAAHRQIFADDTCPWQEAQLNNQMFMHTLFLAPTQHLKEIRGYDEDYTYYGPEDKDILERLIQKGLTQQMLDILSVHLWHENKAIVSPKHYEMLELEKAKKFQGIIRNIDREWGNG